MDYLENQAILTMLKKEKIVDGSVTMLFQHPNYIERSGAKKVNADIYRAGSNPSAFSHPASFLPWTDIKSPEIERFQGFFLRFCVKIDPKSWILKKRQKVFHYYSAPISQRFR